MVRLLQILLEEIELWIEVRRACTTDGRLSVTAGAAIEVHSRPQAVRDLVNILELTPPPPPLDVAYVSALPERPRAASIFEGSAEEHQREKASVFAGCRSKSAL